MNATQTAATIAALDLADLNVSASVIGEREHGSGAWIAVSLHTDTATKSGASALRMAGHRIARAAKAAGAARATIGESRYTYGHASSNLRTGVARTMHVSTW